jgi:hypothetical protein
MKAVTWIAGLAALAAAVCLACLVLGGSDAAADTNSQFVYICRETGRIVTAPPQPTPAVNPETGRTTLYRALYCGKCQSWRAVPPSEVYGGNPMSNVCPRHRERMSPSGPLPAGGRAP